MVRFRADVSRPDTSPNRRSAFTLIEIMVALALLAIVMATVGPNMRRSSVSTKGAALALAAALTEARQQAITQQVPVALVIPSDNGSQGQADSYYIAAGEQPRITQVKRLGGEQSDLRLMVGEWPLDTGKLANPTLTTTITPPPEATWENDFNLNQWALPTVEDYAFIFTPRGKLLTNDLPHFDGAYHLVVSHGGRSTPAAVPGTGMMSSPPTIHSLTQVGRPYTVTIDPTGSVSVSPGLVAAADGGTAIKDQAALDAPPDPPAKASPPSSAPVVTSVALLPDPAKLNLPTGVDMLLAPDRYLTITVRARSPERAPLFCHWTAEDGGLSSSKPIRMTYLPAQRQWEGVWQWRSPAEAAAGDRFQMRGTVLDGHGNEVPVALFSTGADPVIQVGDDSSRIAFTSNRDGTQDVYSMNGDGTGLTRMTNDPSFDFALKWSPDGNLLADYTNRPGNYEIFVMNWDGTLQRNLTTHTASDSSPVWAPRGGTIAFPSDRHGNSEIYLMNADGTGQRNLTNHPSLDEAPTWNSDGSQLAFRSGRYGNSEICRIAADGSGVSNLTNNSPGSDQVPVWSPDGNRIAFESSRDGKYDIYVMNADGSGLRNLTDCPGADTVPVWSPDSSRILFTSDRDGNQEIYVANADGSGVNTNLTNDPGIDGGPSWSKDGSQICFSARRGGNYDVYIMNSDGSGLKNLTRNPSNDNGAIWR